MKLLILTQKVDNQDDVLGFMHRWIAEFAAQCEQVTVVCLFEGRHSLPANVRVFSLGKEVGASRAKYLWNFFRIICRERRAYDSVFVHMNQVYVLLGGLLWRLWGKKIALWYAHGHVSASLRLAEKLTDLIFTPTRLSFRLATKKLYVTGHGIDTDFFIPRNERPLVSSKFRIIIVGRISPVKDCETIILAVEKIHADIPEVNVAFIGGAGLSEHEKYLLHLKHLLNEKKLDSIVSFEGSLANDDIVIRLQQAQLFVNASHTGSLDKAVLEAMSCGLPVLTCNEAFQEVLGAYADQLMFAKKDVEGLAGKIAHFNEICNEERIQIGLKLREIVVHEHGLQRLVQKIISKL